MSIGALWRWIACAFLCVTGPAWALDAPEGRVLLTVTVAQGDGAEPRQQAFDRAMLAELDWREVETFTSFTEGPQRFAGPTLASLFDAMGVEGGTVVAQAINDYSVRFPVSHARDHDVLMALDHNGEAMRVRNKGPIWIIYPLSEDETAFRPFDDEMIWQLDRIRIE